MHLLYNKVFNRHWCTVQTWRLKKHTICVQYHFLKLVHVIRNCVKFWIARQVIDCNLTRRVVVQCWIVKSTKTHCENVLFDLFSLKVNYSHVPQCYVVRTWRVCFGFRVQNVTLSEQMLEKCNNGVLKNIVA